MHFEKIKEIYEAMQKKVQQHPAFAIFTIIGLAILNFIQLLLAIDISREFIAWASLICVAAYTIYEKAFSKPPDYSPVVYHNSLAPQVVESAVFFCNSDPIFHQVKCAEDITDYDYIYNDNSGIYKFFLVKKEAVNIDTEKLSTLGLKIEKRINKRLRNINTRTIRTFDNLPPKIGVVGIEDMGGEVEISIFIANNPDKRKQLAQLKQDQQEARKVVTVDVDKTDDDF